MAITTKEKELAAIGISVAVGCKACVIHHVGAARAAGATDSDMKQAVTHALSVRRSATEVMERYFFARLGEHRMAQVKDDHEGKTDRLKELVSVGVAFAVNCTSNLRKHLAAARVLGIDQDDITTVLKLARLIKGEGAYHVSRYARPTVEERVFLFIDLADSTTIAERLGHKKYSWLIRSCFHDLTDQVIRYHASIYQYAGDEVILSWDAQDGMANHDCVRIFFAFQDKLDQKRQYYEDQFGVTPFFRGGMDLGPVTKSSVGDVKRDVAYHGDVLNCAARLQELCKGYGERFLISHRVQEALAPDRDIVTHFLEDAVLRGKREPVGVYSVEVRRDFERSDNDLKESSENAPEAR